MGPISEIFGLDNIKSWWTQQDETLVYSAPEDIRALAEADGFVFPADEDLLDFIQCGLTEMSDDEKKAAVDKALSIRKSRNDKHSVAGRITRNFKAVAKKSTRGMTAGSVGKTGLKLAAVGGAAYGAKKLLDKFRNKKKAKKRHEAIETTNLNDITDILKTEGVDADPVECLILAIEEDESFIESLDPALLTELGIVEDESEDTISEMGPMGGKVGKLAGAATSAKEKLAKMKAMAREKGAKAAGATGGAIGSVIKAAKTHPKTALAAAGIGGALLMRKKIKKFFKKHESKVLDVESIKQLAEEEGFEFSDRAAIHEFIRMGLENDLDENAEETPLTEAEIDTLDEAYESILTDIHAHCESGEPLDLGVIRVAAEKVGLTFENLNELREFAQFIVPALVEDDGQKKPGFFKKWGKRVLGAAALGAAAYGAHKFASAGKFGKTAQNVAGMASNLGNAAKSSAAEKMQAFKDYRASKAKPQTDSLDTDGDDLDEAGEDEDASAPLSAIDMDEPADEDGDDFPGLEDAPEVDAKGDMGPSSDTEEKNSEGSQDPAMGSGKAPEGGDKGTEGPSSDTTDMDSDASMKMCPVCADSNPGYRAMCQKCGTVLPVNSLDSDGGVPAQGRMMGGSPEKSNPQSDPGEVKGVKSPYGGSANKNAYIGDGAGKEMGPPTSMSAGRKMESTAVVIDQLLRGAIARELLAEEDKKKSDEVKHKGSFKKAFKTAAGATMGVGAGLMGMGAIGGLGAAGGALAAGHAMRKRQHSSLETDGSNLSETPEVEEAKKEDDKPAEHKGIKYAKKAAKAVAQATAGALIARGAIKGAQNIKAAIDKRAAKRNEKDREHHVAGHAHDSLETAGANLSEDGDQAQLMPLSGSAGPEASAPSMDGVNQSLAQNGFHPIEKAEIDQIAGFLTQLGENVRKVAQYTGHPLPVVQIVANLMGLSPAYGYTKFDSK